jgi:hypothetical protein
MLALADSYLSCSNLVLIYLIVIVYVAVTLIISANSQWLYIILIKWIGWWQTASRVWAHKDRHAGAQPARRLLRRGLQAHAPEQQVPAVVYKLRLRFPCEWHHHQLLYYSPNVACIVVIVEVISFPMYAVTSFLSSVKHEFSVDANIIYG